MVQALHRGISSDTTQLCKFLINFSIKNFLTLVTDYLVVIAKHKGTKTWIHCKTEVYSSIVTRNELFGVGTQTTVIKSVNEFLVN